jgi:signal transduction histidine kinase/DNA-binding response OmpR family regulator
MFIADVLQEAGYEVLAVDSLEAARRDASHVRPALAIVDAAIFTAAGAAAVHDALGSAPIIVGVHDAAAPAMNGTAGRIVRPFREEEILRCVQEAMSTPRKHRATVLVIDDSHTFREQLREAIESAGYRVITADTGERGLAIANSEDVNAFVVDNVLPGISGAAVVRRLRQDVRHRRTPSLLLTASEDPEQELFALEAGADAFVRKDKSVEVVLARLAAVLRSVGSPAIPHEPSGLKRRASVLFLTPKSPSAHEAAQSLKEEGVAVQSTDSIRAAQGEYDCIVVDADDEKEAESIVQAVRADERNRLSRVVLLEPCESSGALVEAFALGADDYLSYAAGPEVLTARVRAQLRRKQLEDENEQARESLIRHRMELETQKQIAMAREALAEELKIARDIAEQKAQEAADLLAQSEAVFSSMAEGLAIFDLQGALAYANRSALKIFGVKDRSALADLLRPSSVSCELKMMEGTTVPPEQTPLAHALRGESNSGVELVFRRRDNGYSFVGSFSAVPVRTREGKQILAAVTVRDITLQKQSEAALRRTEKLAATGRLAASIAHEINNPLAAITNALYLLETPVASNPQAAAFLAMAQNELQRVTHITKQTLAFYRESSTPAEVDLCTLAQEVADVFAAKLRSCGLELVMELDCSEHPLAFAGELRQVMSNLVANAIDASEPGNRIRLRIRPGRAHGRQGVWISVADRGRGIPRDFYPEVFKPFASSKGMRGTGLGLWVTQSIVARHEGFIRFYSSTRPGKSGTVFAVFIPLLSAIRDDTQDSVSALFREVGRELLSGQN